MRDAELLKATGNVWKVTVYADASLRRRLSVIYIRAQTFQGAERAALAIRGGRAAVACAWDPMDPSERIGPYVRRSVAEKG